MAKDLTWAEAIEQVMLKNNYFATLKLLHEEAPKLKSFYGKTPHKTINERVQRDDRFTRIAPGVWALTKYLNELPSYLNPNVEKSQAEEEKFTHSLVQGMLIEVGNIEKFGTYTPDKNRYFLNQRLGDLTTIDKIPVFTYDYIVQSIQYIDVIWFNSRKFPYNVIEVEHSTNFQNSLIKFIELQDFQTKMTVVSPQDRFEKFSKEIKRPAFVSICKRAKFLSYENLEKYYSNLVEYRKLSSLF